MNEKLLQYLWNFKIFEHFDFKDAEGNAIEILDYGRWNRDSGPDFINARIKIKGVILAGNIELHLRSSDWIFHRHGSDRAFDNVILHVVYLDDAEIEEFTERNVPTLELRHHIDAGVLWKYEQMASESGFIPCEKIFDPQKVPFDFTEETLLKKLDTKAEEIRTSLLKSKNDYEAVLFQYLAYAFGLKVNAQVFRQIAESIDFSIVRKIRQNGTQLEALFFGMAGWLDQPCDPQTQNWKREFDFIKTKYQIPPITIQPKFLRLRPPNFPTLRLSQLAHLYHREDSLFSKIIKAKNPESVIKILDGVKASAYWDSRFNFGKISPAVQEKFLTKDFIQLILINAVLPVKYAYYRNHNEAAADDILDFYRAIPAEKNTITEGWKKLGVNIADALHSQAFIFHYKINCQTKNCLNCSIGLQLLKKEKI